MNTQQSGGRFLANGLVRCARFPWQLCVARRRFVVSVGGCTTPAAPGNFRFTRAGSLVTLDWDETAGASDYIIEVGSASDASDLLVVPLFSAPVSLGSTGRVPRPCSEPKRLRRRDAVE